VLRLSFLHCQGATVFILFNAKSNNCVG